MDDDERYIIGKPHPDRARQFKPFAALKGYYDLIKECERVPEQRRELTEERQCELSTRLSQLERGSVVRVVHYDRDAYVETTGAVSQVDEVYGKLWIVRTPIAFEDIDALEHV